MSKQTDESEINSDFEDKSPEPLIPGDIKKFNTASDKPVKRFSDFALSDKYKLKNMEEACNLIQTLRK